MREAGRQAVNRFCLRLTNQEEIQAYYLVKLITTRTVKTIIMEGSGSGDHGLRDASLPLIITWFCLEKFNCICITFKVI